MGPGPDCIALQAVDITPEALVPFVEVVAATEDGKSFDEDAQLVHHGQPRLIMRLPHLGPHHLPRPRHAVPGRPAAAAALVPLRHATHAVARQASAAGGLDSVQGAAWRG